MAMVGGSYELRGRRAEVARLERLVADLRAALANLVADVYRLIERRCSAAEPT